jgi:tetratricopeptide (TPR) repeat protein
MFYLFNSFGLQIKSIAKSAIFIFLLFNVCDEVVAQTKKKDAQQYRTAQTVGTVTYKYTSKNYCCTKISYLGRTLTLKWIAYGVGDHLIVAYDPKHINNAAPILERPYFKKGELPDTTEGVLHISDTHSCQIFYKTYDISDSMDIVLDNAHRYLSEGMFDTLTIKENYIYKIAYNRKSGNAEVLFNEIIDSTHQQRNKHLFGALEQVTYGSPIAAIGDLDECIRLDPQNDYYYYYQRGKTKESIREYKHAAEDFTKYIEAKPMDKRGYVWRATIYIHMGNFDEAEKDVTKLFSLNNNDAEAYYLQGAIYYHKKEYQKAIDFYSNAIKHANGLNLEVYYYDRAQAEEKLYGKKDKNYKHDYNLAKREAIKNGVSKMRGHHTHEEGLHHNIHGVYVTLTSDNTLGFNSAKSMQAELIVPYMQNTTPETYDKTFSLNHSNHNTSFSLGLLSLELGGYKRMYARVEASIVLNNGNGPPSSFRSVLGYNIKFTKKDVFILRPEMGFTYFNRTITMDAINFNGATQLTIMGKQFNYYTDKDHHTDNVGVSFRENVLSLSPSLGLWLWPYSSKLVVRVGMGYNFVFSQKSSIYFQSNKSNMRESLSNLNMQVTNTNGNNNLFSYNGFFINVGVGIRF